MNPLAAGVAAGNRRALSKALTLIESNRVQDNAAALDLLRVLTAHNNSEPTTQVDSFSIGLSGPPGAGKSTLIETLGCLMVEQGHQVAVLAVDPSSQMSGGAILGDKTRMPRLSALPQAYVRPTPSRGTLGGVARSTLESMSVCVAAGYNRVLVETVGVGQSEISVANLVDCMTLVLPPVGGDELQSIKRGITEVADIVVVNKADGVTKDAALRAAKGFAATMPLRPPRRRHWRPTVLAISSRTGAGMAALQDTFENFRASLSASGELDKVRGAQRVAVSWSAAEELALTSLRHDVKSKIVFDHLIERVRKGEMAPREAASEVVAAFKRQEERRNF
jgi:LAO/AO transport system kinase